MSNRIRGAAEYAAGRRVEVYLDRAPIGEWRWRKIARNGRIVGVGGEGYATRFGAVRAARRENPGIPVR